MLALATAVQVTFCFTAILLGVAASAIFAGLETGTYVLNKVRLELRSAGPDHRARRLSRALARPQELLVSLLIGTNAAHYLVTVPTVLLFAMYGTQNPQLYATAAVTPVLFVLGELVPKNVFRVAGETLTYRLSWVVTAVMGACRWIGLSPVVLAVGGVMLRLWPGHKIGGGEPEPRQRVRTFLAEGHAQGVLTQFQSHMADRVVSMQSTTVREVMVELSRVVSIPAECPEKQFVETLARHDFSRLPVGRDRPDNIVGIVNIYDVLRADDGLANLTDHVRPPICLAETLNVSEALVTLQRAHLAMGLVVSATDKPVGIVTIKDLVEEIVGELEAW
ncbi:MAG: DUF21 domain-containing protein [Planctomycetes bacterium]|nr:DUF21 domain-containing protein [Planctomycetota bacterium]